MADIVILGAGVMGSAMAIPAAERGHRVALVGTHLDDEIIEGVQGGRPHPRLGLTLPSSLSAHRWTAFGQAMQPRPDLVILGVASAGVGWAIERLAETLTEPVPVLMITKGLAPMQDGIRAFPPVVVHELARRTGLSVPAMAVGGPCIAGELAAERDTTVVMTGSDAGLLERTARMFSAPFYHPHLSDDVVGVEVCAAFKNFYALAVGAVAGVLERHGRAANGAMMHNQAAAIFSQAVAEMAVLAEHLGGRPESAFGLPGAGDLYVTCQAGRNSRMGRLLGLGIPYSQAKAEHMPTDTVEGAELALALGPTIGRMMADGSLPARRLPLARAILAAVCDDGPLTLAI